jgi:hypothetical protein
LGFCDVRNNHSSRHILLQAKHSVDLKILDQTIKIKVSCSTGSNRNGEPNTFFARYADLRPSGTVDDGNMLIGYYGTEAEWRFEYYAQEATRPTVAGAKHCGGRVKVIGHILLGCGRGRIATMSRLATSRIPPRFGNVVFPMGLERYRPMQSSRHDKHGYLVSMWSWQLYSHDWISPQIGLRH